MYLGVDCGTQSTKVVVVDLARGATIGEASRPHRMIEGARGRREQDPAQWIEAFIGAFHAAIASAGVSSGDIRGIGVSGQQHGMVALDARDQVLYPAKLWCDTETHAHNQALIGALGGEEGCLARLGLVPQTGYTASKVAWLREHHRDIYDRVDGVLLPHDYLNLWLTGERVSEAGDASGTGYFDSRSRRWSPEVWQWIAPELDPARVLPRLIDSRDTAGQVRPVLARELGLSPGVAVASGGGDNMLGAIGTGNIVPGKVTMSLGTSGTVCAHSDHPVLADSAMVANFCASHAGWLPLVCTMNTTSATNRVRELFGLDLAGFNQALAQAPVGADGVTVLPFFNGERVPSLPEASASFLGLTSRNTSPAHLCRAVVEGATFCLRYGLDLMGPLADQARQIRLIGGGAHSAAWRQMVADITATEVVCPRVTDAAALGGAIQAAWCAREGELDELCQALVQLDEGSRAEPDAGRVKRYGEVYLGWLVALDRLHG